MSGIPDIFPDQVRAHERHKQKQKKKQKQQQEHDNTSSTGESVPNVSDCHHARCGKARLDKSAYSVHCSVLQQQQQQEQ